MILFNLKCAKDHVFEGWFRNGGACEEQVADKAVACPVCGSRKIEKAPMAPRIAKGGGSRDEAGGPAVPQGPAAEKAAGLMQALRELRASQNGNASSK